MKKNIEIMLAVLFLWLLTISIIGCKKEVITKEELKSEEVIKVKVLPIIEYIPNTGITTKEFVKANNWPITYRHTGNGCNSIVVFIQGNTLLGHVIQALNVEQSIYNSNTLTGDQLYQLLLDRNYWK